MNIEQLKDEASDLYFALRSNADADTMAEISADMLRFVCKLDRHVINGELTVGIAEKLKAIPRMN